MSRRQRKRAEVRAALLRRRRSYQMRVWQCGGVRVEMSHWKGRARMYRALGLRL
jgi:hypothetical protein